MEMKGSVGGVCVVDQCINLTRRRNVRNQRTSISLFIHGDYTVRGRLFFHSIIIRLLLTGQQSIISLFLSASFLFRGALSRRSFATVHLVVVVVVELGGFVKRTAQREREGES